MLIKIKSGNFDVYTNEIIHPEEFSKLYGKEEILQEFKTQINNVINKPFAISITPEGKEFLQLIKKIKEAYNVKNLDLDKIKKKKSTSELLQFGIINIDKPSGPTSFTVSQFVKKQLGLKKTSHLGTLE